MKADQHTVYIKEATQKQIELQTLYDDFVAIESPEKLAVAQEIIGRIGSVDAEIEKLKSTENQRDLSIKFHWGHNHRFHPDLQVSGRMGNRHVNLMAQFMTRYKKTPEDFAGKSIIDVGCWTGGTTLLLKALGAGHILALEEVQKYALAAKDLVSDVYDIHDVSSEGTNLFDLDPPQKYDIAYFPGVIYHLSDPVLGLRRLFNALKDGGEIFVETAGLDSDEPICRFDGNRIFKKNTSAQDAQNLNRGGWNWFSPSPSCLERWMLEAGFDDLDCFFSPSTKRVFGYGRRRKFQEITRAGFSRPDIA